MPKNIKKEILEFNSKEYAYIHVKTKSEIKEALKHLANPDYKDKKRYIIAEKDLIAEIKKRTAGTGIGILDPFYNIVKKCKRKIKK
ncbi:MAG: hypothetical protein ACTSRZ_04560 [Promethearchaeota archaeon]